MKKFFEIFPRNKKFYAKNNKVGLIGLLGQAPQFSHEIKGVRMFESKIKISEDNKHVDFIPLIFPEKLLSVLQFAFENKRLVNVLGEFRSMQNGKNLKIHVIVKGCFINKSFEDMENRIYLRGFICKKMNFYGETANCQTDIMLAVNENFGRSFYIPCVAYNQNAQILKDKEIGTEMKLWGKIQSREYFKKGKSHEAYEVAIEEIFY